MEQLEPKLAFESPHALGQRRLGDMEKLGCPTEGAVIGYSDDVLEMANLHADSISVGSTPTDIHRAYLCLHGRQTLAPESPVPLGGDSTAIS
jgi:hypothetical protein